MREGDLYRMRAHYGLGREAVQHGLLQPLRLDRSSVTGRVALDGKIIQIPDVLADPEYHATDHQQAFGYTTILGVPLLRDGTMIGVLSLTRFCAIDRGGVSAVRRRSLLAHVANSRRSIEPVRQSRRRASDRLSVVLHYLEEYKLYMTPEF